ncbi:hypothetical protein [Neisseria animalis]|uniref:hypothetical protein n=1 Tax=Neisseria animalis TaxID=492 RepID=UPI001479369B|nr:hypothetical protein [Neisseria animalis]
MSAAKLPPPPKYDKCNKLSVTLRIIRNFMLLAFYGMMTLSFYFILRLMAV